MKIAFAILFLVMHFNTSQCFLKFLLTSKMNSLNFKMQHQVNIIQYAVKHYIYPHNLLSFITRMYKKRSCVHLPSFSNRNNFFPGILHINFTIPVILNTAALQCLEYLWDGLSLLQTLAGYLPGAASPALLLPWLPAHSPKATNHL